MTVPPETSLPDLGCCSILWLGASPWGWAKALRVGQAAGPRHTSQEVSNENTAKPLPTGGSVCRHLLFHFFFSFSLSLSFCLPVCPSLSVYLSIPITVSFSHSLCLTQSAYLTSYCLSFSVSLPHSLSISVCVSLLSLPFSSSLCLSLAPHCFVSPSPSL